jgi:dihydrofolate reductase
LGEYRREPPAFEETRIVSLVAALPVGFPCRKRRLAFGSDAERREWIGVGRIVVSSMVALDGVMGAPERWAFPFADEEFNRWALDELLASDALLLGRTTYEGFADYWPTAEDGIGLADRMNAMPKFVVSTTLEGALAWNATLIEGDLVEAVSDLKRRAGGDVLVLASADLVHELARQELVDEYRLRLAPVLAGGGKRLLGEVGEPKALRLVGTETFASGVVVLTYRPAEQDG